MPISCSNNTTPPSPQPQEKFVQAAADGDVATVKKCLVAAATTTTPPPPPLDGCPGGETIHINGRNCQGYTALLAAAMRGHVDVMKLLLLDGPNVEDIDTSLRDPFFDTTALGFSAQTGNMEGVLLLLEHNSSLNSSDNGARATLQNDIDEAFVLAARSNHHNITQLLLNKYDANINSERTHGENALFVARDDSQMVLFLLQHGIDLDHRADDLCTPLFRAAAGGHLNTVELLVGSGAAINARNQYGSTPIMVAATCHHDKTVQFLLANDADIDTADRDGATALLKVPSYAFRRRDQISIQQRLLMAYCCCCCTATASELKVPQLLL